eukprot:TRINITY_DN5365_c0_g1_i3.p1 TRINITY_DN5365_c0_g1~~TRINITY_DN5365_c0_g1_i3.p1  ORF type:complete len:1224 (+),score=251.97 TRINITY_DN5365_c0_g1_i3:112-3783(+)
MESSSPIGCRANPQKIDAMAAPSTHGRLQPTAALFYLHHTRSCAASANGSQCGSNDTPVCGNGLSSVCEGSLGMPLQVVHPQLSVLVDLLAFLAIVTVQFLKVRADWAKEQAMPMNPVAKASYPIRRATCKLPSMLPASASSKSFGAAALCGALQWLAEVLVTLAVLAAAASTLWKPSCFFVKCSVSAASWTYLCLWIKGFHCSTPSRCRALSVILPLFVISLEISLRPEITLIDCLWGISVCGLAAVKPAFMPDPGGVASTGDVKDMQVPGTELVYKAFKQCIGSNMSGSKLKHILQQLGANEAYEALLLQILGGHDFDDNVTFDPETFLNLVFNVKLQTSTETVKTADGYPVVGQNVASSQKSEDSASHGIIIPFHDFCQITHKLRNNELLGAAAADALEAAAGLKASHQSSLDTVEAQQEQLPSIHKRSNVQDEATCERDLIEENKRKAKEAEYAYERVINEHGGQEHIKERFSDLSKQVKEEVQRHLGNDESWRQDKIMHHLGLEGLTVVGEQIKKQFDLFVKRIASQFNAEPMIPRLKGPERSRVKVNVRYGGDASQLSDVVRATLVFQTIDDMYGAVKHLIFHEHLFGTRLCFTHFADRYQNPFKGGYRDILCLIRVLGFICELQFNLEAIIKIKEGLGHVQYEIDRKNNDDLMEAAMKANLKVVVELLRKGADPNASRDMYSLTALHYAAQHGDVSMVTQLVDAKADVLAQDQDGKLPIFRAVMLQHEDVVKILLNTMEVTDTKLFRHLTGHHTAAALELAPDGSKINLDLAQRLAQWESRCLAEGQALAHCWASSDLSEALSQATRLEILLDDELTKEDIRGCRPLDVAIRQNSSSTAAILMSRRCTPSQPYLQENCSRELSELLDKYCSGSPFERNKSMIKGKNMYKAAMRGDLKTLQAFWLTDADLNERDSSGKQPVIYAAEFAARTGRADMLKWFELTVPGHALAPGVRSLSSTGGPGGTEAFAVLKEDGSVVAWGDGDCGGKTGKAQQHLNSGVKSLISASNRVSSGAFAVVKEDGSVIAWGDGECGGKTGKAQQHLKSGVTSLHSTEAAFAALKDDGSVIAWGDGECGGETGEAQQHLKSGVTSLHSTNYAFAALKEDGSVVTWGEFFGGEPGEAQHLNSGVKSLHSTQAAFAALKDDGSVVAWGDSDCGGETGEAQEHLKSGVKSLFSFIGQDGGAFAALKEDGSVEVWGDQSCQSAARAAAHAAMGGH